MSPLNSYRVSCLKEVRAVCTQSSQGSRRPPGPALSDTAVGMAPPSMGWCSRFGDDAWQFLKSCSPVGASGTKPRG